MPWTIDQVDEHKKGLSPEQKKKWVTIANAVLKNCQSKGEKDCEKKAIMTANSRVKKSSGGDNMAEQKIDKITETTKITEYTTGEKAVEVNAGPGGTCYCPECGHTQKHEIGVACNTIKCEKCGHTMERKVESTKSDYIEKAISFVSKNVEKREITGIVLEPEKVDLQGDIYSAEVIEAACNKFNDEVRRMGIMHKTFESNLKPMQSYIVDCDEGYITVNGNKCVNGTWILKARAMDDDTWNVIKEGKITGWSIGAWVAYIPVEEVA